MDLKYLFMMILLVIDAICLIYMIYSFYKKENSVNKKGYRYTIFYKNGKKVINTFHLTDEENKEFNDFLNKSPLVSYYTCLELD